jgi:hypothetical protein
MTHFKIQSLIAIIALSSGAGLAYAQTPVSVNLGTPNGGYFSFTLAPGGSTAPFTLPLNIPWHVTAAATTWRIGLL